MAHLLLLDPPQRTEFRQPLTLRGEQYVCSHDWCCLPCLVIGSARGIPPLKIFLCLRLPATVQPCLCGLSARPAEALSPVFLPADSTYIPRVVRLAAVRAERHRLTLIVSFTPNRSLEQDLR